MADSDVKLLHGQVKVEAWDLCLDSKDRRKNDTPHRRALVHDFGDRLTLNYAGNYPNGVHIKWKTVIEGDCSVKGKNIILERTDIAYISGLGHKENVALSHSDGNKLTINKGEGYGGGVEIEGKLLISDKNQDANNKKWITIEHGHIISHHFNTGWYTFGSGHVRSFDIVDELMNMKNEIKELKEKVKNLGG